MKILLLNNLYEPFAKGGAERIVKITAEGLRDAGHEVVVVTTIAGKLKDNAKAKSQENGMSIYRFVVLNWFPYVTIDKKPVWHRAIWRIFDMVNLHSYFLIKKVIQAEKPDMVYGHNLTGLGYLTPRAVWSTKTRYVQMLHDVQYAFPNGLLLVGQEAKADTWFMRLYQAICRWLFKGVKELISPSRWLLDFYQSKRIFPNANAHVLPNPYSLTPVPSTKSLVPKGLLFLGQLEPHKGIDLLLRSLPTDPTLKLTVVGAGSLSPMVQQQYAGDHRITFVGKVSATEVGKYYQESSLVVVPSICYENSPGVIYEAFAYGKPVIAAKLGGIPELVADGNNGWLFEAGNSDALEATIEKALAIPDYEPYARAARESINNNTVKNYIEKILGM